MEDGPSSVGGRVKCSRGARRDPVSPHGGPFVLQRAQCGGRLACSAGLAP